MKFKAILVLALICTLVFGQNQTLKKITYVESNNPILNYNYEKLYLKDSINTQELIDLKNYVLSKTTIKSNSEPLLFFELMEWVSNQWEHNGFNAAPNTLNALGILKSAHNDGEQYRCVEYGIVLTDILNSFGYVSRNIGLKHVNTAYGGFGMGHVATEVWSNNLNKWIFLDPQFSIYAQKNNVPLNIYEIYELKKAGKFSDIEFIEVKTNKINADYGTNFLGNYLGYIDIFQKHRNLAYSLTLKMEGKDDFLTFQSFPKPKMVFTNNNQDVYFGINETMIIIDYNKEEMDRVNDEYSKLDLKTNEDFINNMPLISAKPNFVLNLDNNMPWFKNYEVKLNGKEIKSDNNKFFVNLKNGINTIEAVAINQNNIKGIPTKLKIKYE